MRQHFHFDSLLIYSEKHKKFHYSIFDEKVNLIHGPNTAGKSTLLQSLIYVFGVNDVRGNLKELTDLEVFFRLDLTMSFAGVSEKITIIRDCGTIYIKRENIPILIFNGIDGDSSYEHIKLKEYLHSLFGFSLFLESKDGFKPAPIEVIFLPYYISQAVGWVYLRKSFSSLDYYKNFKEDFLDYYLGIETATDREHKKKLEEEVAKLQKEEQFLIDMEMKDHELQVMKISDESFTKESLIYLETYRKNQESVANAEKEFLIKSNELSYLQERKSVISRVKLNHEKQKPSSDQCPVCDQLLPGTFAEEYAHIQERNDTLDQLLRVKTAINKVQSDLNSLQKSIERDKALIARNYDVFRSYSDREFSMDKWLDDKANIQLDQKIKLKLGQISIDLSSKNEDLKKYKTDKQVDEDRQQKNIAFSTIFANYLKELTVKPLTEERFTKLYKITSFPYQGVELHTTVMAYHFAFNLLTFKTENVHRLPFVLDGVFKEDVDDNSKDLIIKFISKNKPADTQIFFSVAEKSDKPSQVARYNRQYFNGSAKLILIGDGKTKRSLLKDYNESVEAIVSDSVAIINNHP